MTVWMGVAIMLLVGIPLALYLAAPDAPFGWFLLIQLSPAIMFLIGYAIALALIG